MYNPDVIANTVRAAAMMGDYEAVPAVRTACERTPGVDVARDLLALGARPQADTHRLQGGTHRGHFQTLRRRGHTGDRSRRGGPACTNHWRDEQLVLHARRGSQISPASDMGINQQSATDPRRTSAGPGSRG